MKPIKVLFSYAAPFAFIYVIGTGLFLAWWLGDAALRYESTTDGYFLQLRAQPDAWVAVGPVVYFLYVSARGIAFVVGAIALSYVLWRWLWHGDFGNKKLGIDTDRN